MGGCVRVLCAVVFAVVFSMRFRRFFPVVGDILLLCVCPVFLFVLVSVEGKCD